MISGPRFKTCWERPDRKMKPRSPSKEPAGFNNRFPILKSWLCRKSKSVASQTRLTPCKPSTPGPMRSVSSSTGKVPRHVNLNVVKSIVLNLPPFVLPVGVFVNEEPEKVRKTMDECGLALAQIHGDESAEYCESLGRPVIRGIRLRDRNTLFAMAEYKGRSRVRGFVLDAFSTTAYGGTGKTADWDLATEAAQSFSFLLAGGLTADNVQEAIRKVRPYGVDVSSGVEARSGQERSGQSDGLHPSRQTCLTLK